MLAWSPIKVLRAHNSLPPIRDRPPHPELLPILFMNSVWVSSTSHGIYMCMGCETGPMVYRPYPRRLESLTIIL